MSRPPNYLATRLPFFSTQIKTYNQFLGAFVFGVLLPLSFAPFHLPMMAIISVAFFYSNIFSNQKQSFLTGFFYGLGFFGIGISWIFVSVHDYGHQNNLASLLITLALLTYLSLFIALQSWLFNKIIIKHALLYNCFIFSALWTLSEYLRSHLFTGLPWLLLGFGQFDTISKYLLPVIGTYGVSFCTCLISTILATSIHLLGKKRYYFLSLAFILLLCPIALQHKDWSTKGSKPLTVSIIQANLSMRDKWDESLFWQLLQRYSAAITKVLGTDLIVLPESAIPLPSNYQEVADFLQLKHRQAKQAGSAVLFGILETKDNYYFNSIKGIGSMQGSYLKQHLVPFGEYIPKPLKFINNLLDVPNARLQPGPSKQKLLEIQKHPIATLICYELAYGGLLRKQLPNAEWIVAVSENGWFGHSLAMYQQQQMAQVRSMETGRYQVLANNDGLSSIINNKGEIISSLPAFSTGIINNKIFPATGHTPWIFAGDWPVLLFCCLVIIFRLILIILLKYKFL